jgi:hypothetical protein
MNIWLFLFVPMVFVWLAVVWIEYQAKKNARMLQEPSIFHMNTHHLLYRERYCVIEKRPIRN